MAKKKTRTPIPNLSKVRALLQKEIGSTCPFCKNEDVGHFEIHHIDENPSNHVLANLLLLCPNCHSKITKRDITHADVLKTKQQNNNNNSLIQFVSVTIDNENCGWLPIEGVSNAFRVEELKSLFPILNFSFINHSEKTVLMTNIVITTKQLPIGLSGPYIPLPEILRTMIRYKIKLPNNGETVNTILDDIIEIPERRAFKFQVELFSDSMDRFNPQFYKYALSISFGFNNDFYIDIPKILLNTAEDYDQLKHYIIN